MLIIWDLSRSGPEMFGTNLVIEPALISQGQQVLQSQSVFLVDDLKRQDGFLNDCSLVPEDL